MALNQSILNKLCDIVGAENVLTAKEDLIPYAFDGTAALKETPGCVAFAAGTEHVSNVLKLANDTGTPVVTRGSGTGLSGGSVPAVDCIVLCTVKMEQVIEVDAANLTMMVEPGVTTVRIAEDAAKAGLFYPPDPGSMKISTIGGNVAENSGGLRGLKYGVTRNYVMGLEVVLPDGEVMWLGNKCVKDVAGFSLKDVMIGSEGTLGVITKVLLKLIPKPAAKKNDGRHLQRDGCRGSNRQRHHRRADHPVHAGVPRPHHDPLCGGLRESRPAARLRGAAVDGNRRPSRCRRRGSRQDGGTG